MKIAKEENVIYVIQILFKNKNWYGFARLYNGRYAKRYAARMANAYKRYKQSK